MGQITSLSNPKVKLARSLTRRRARYETRRFLAEGVRLVETGLRGGHIPAFVFYDEAALPGEPRAQTLLHALQARTEVHSVPAALLEELAQTESPQGLVAVFDFPSIPVPLHPARQLVLDAVRDPGNLGTIMRSAWAAGVDGVWLSPSTVDPYNPKVVRAGMGAHFHLPVQAVAWHALAVHLAGVPRIYLADARGELNYAKADWAPPVALIIGGEAEGAGAAARQLATARVAIPLAGGAESLNAAMAATVLLFEAVRNRPR